MKNNYARLACVLAFLVMAVGLSPYVGLGTASTDERIGGHFKEIFTSTGVDAYAFSEVYASLYVDNQTDTTARAIMWAQSNSGVVDIGVVFATHDNPTIFDTNVSRKAVQPGEHMLELTGLRPDTDYYARAYVMDGGTPVYSKDTLRFHTTYLERLPSITTGPVIDVSDNWVDIRINVFSNGDAEVLRRGVVYSRENETPSTLGGTDFTKYTDSVTGAEVVRISGLRRNTTYYIQAFATNKYGTAFGPVVQVYTSETKWATSAATWLSTEAVRDIADNAAVVDVRIYDGYIRNASVASDFIERGVVYSRYYLEPTVEKDVAVPSDTPLSSRNSYTVSLSKLRSATVYAVRAYVKTSTGYAYGNTINFVTTLDGIDPLTGKASPAKDDKSKEVKISITYKTGEGEQVGRQDISVKPGTVIRSADLKVPAGFQLTDSDFSYKAISIAMVTVAVSRPNTVWPYMNSNGSLFEPNRNITRIEIAKMIHALHGYAQVQSDTVYRFSDIAEEQGQADADAVRYVTSKGYMTGYTDGSFRPYHDITRAEAAVIINLVYVPNNNLQKQFSDTVGHWAESAVSIVAGNGMISGYPNNQFKPNANITRAEACALFARAEKRDLMPLGEEPFTDVPASHWAYRFIMNAARPLP